jgi:hypothetical protein
MALYNLWSNLNLNIFWTSGGLPLCQVARGYCYFLWGSAAPCASPPPRPSIYSDYSFWVHHPVDRDDPTSPCTCNGLWFLSRIAVSLRENNFFSLWIKLRALLGVILCCIFFLFSNKFMYHVVRLGLCKLVWCGPLLSYMCWLVKRSLQALTGVTRWVCKKSPKEKPNFSFCQN